MRKLLLILFILCASISIHAQIQKGSVFLGGNLSVGIQKSKLGNSTSFKQSGVSISPVYGKFIKDNLVLGGEAGFSYNHEESPQGYERNADTYSAGVFLRNYKRIGSGGFYLFIQGGLRVSHMEEDRINQSGMGSIQNTKRLSATINAYPGISYAVSRKFHLELAFMDVVNLNYYREKSREEIPSTPSVPVKTTGFYAASSLNSAGSYLYLGFRVLLHK